MPKNEYAGSSYMMGYYDAWGGHSSQLGNYSMFTDKDMEDYEQGYEDGEADYQAPDLTDEAWSRKLNELYDLIWPGRRENV